MKPIYSGKVREIYDISGEHLIIVTTDRISAFDNILPMPVKGKGIVLNTLSNFWFEKTGNIVPESILLWTQALYQECLHRLTKG